jgi:hypothetical protein
LLTDLVWGPRTSAFEQAWADLAWHIGLAGQRPERDIGAGPDDLWALPDGNFIVCEAKTDRGHDHAVYKKDAEQLSNSMDWFRGQYPGMNAVPLLVHPQERFDAQAAVPTSCRVINLAKLDGLRSALQRWTTSLADHDSYRDVSRVGQLLDAQQLTTSTFIAAHTTNARRGR